MSLQDNFKEISNLFQNENMAGSEIHYLALSDDEVSRQINIGFNFSFFCETYSDIRVSSNGWLTFNGNDEWGWCHERGYAYISASSSIGTTRNDWNCTSNNWHAPKGLGADPETSINNMIAFAWEVRRISFIFLIGLLACIIKCITSSC